MDFDLEYIKSIMSESDRKALNLADTQLLGLYILIIGYIVLIKSSSQNRELILRKYINFKTPNPDPLQTAIYGTKINISAIMLLLYVVFIRQSDTDLAYSNRIINTDLYNPSTNLSKIALIGFIITLVTLSSLIKISKIKSNTKSKEEEEVIF